MMSAVAPGGMGTIQRIGLPGYACESAAEQTAGTKTNSAAVQTSVFLTDAIPIPPLVRWGRILTTGGASGHEQLLKIREGRTNLPSLPRTPWRSEDRHGQQQLFRRGRCR